MSINTSASPKVFPIRRVLLTGLTIILAVAVTTGFVWTHTDPVIAPPGLRLIEGLWKFFVCRCPVFPELFSF
jgi:hypothetical protein